MGVLWKHKASMSMRMTSNAPLSQMNVTNSQGSLMWEASLDQTLSVVAVKEEPLPALSKEVPDSSHCPMPM